jgi:phosphoribosylanthranilate isomerase
VATVPVFREGVDSPEAVAAGLTGHHRRFLYEGVESGIGRKVDWGRASRISTIGEMSLAGGLSPDNVVEAIRRVMPFGVDVSSGVEAAPGVKDPVLIRRFVESARSVDAERTRP